MSDFKSTRVFTYAVALSVVGALLLAALGGCGSSTKSNQTQGSVSSMKVTAGQDFTISLQSNPSTGYQWQLAEPLNEKVLKKVNSIYQPADTSGGSTVGIGGVEIWTFMAVGKGNADIKMKYVRPSQKGAKPTEERVFKVTVG